MLTFDEIVVVQAMETSDKKQYYETTTRKKNKLKQNDTFSTDLCICLLTLLAIIISDGKYNNDESTCYGDD